MNSRRAAIFILPLCLTVVLGGGWCICGSSAAAPTRVATKTGCAMGCAASRSARPMSAPKQAACPFAAGVKSTGLCVMPGVLTLLPLKLDRTIDYFDPILALSVECPFVERVPASLGRFSSPPVPDLAPATTLLGLHCALNC